MRIPSGTTGVEIWFEGRGSTGTTSWDSRYGDNYLFPVTEDGLPIPECSVILRTDSLCRGCCPSGGVYRPMVPAAVVTDSASGWGHPLARSP